MNVLQSAQGHIRTLAASETTALVGLKVGSSVLRLASNLILTRILAPEAFGAVGIIVSIRFVLAMVSDLGFRAFLIRNDRSDDEFLNTLWSVQLVRNILLTAVMIAGAALFARAYGNPQLTTAVAITGLLFLFEGVAPMSMFIAERAQQIRRISIIEFVEVCLTIAFTIGAALLMRSYWAIIVGIFAGASFRLFVSFFVLPSQRLRFKIEKDVLVELWAFSRIVIPSSIVSIFLTQTDKFLMAQSLPLEKLGLFMLATTLTLAVVEIVNLYTTRVFFPLLSQANRTEPNMLKSLYYGSRLRLVCFLAFGVGGLIGGAEVLITVLFDDRYLEASTYLSILCLAPLLRLFSFPAEQCLVVKGYIAATLTGNLFRMGWIVVLGFAAYYLSGPLAVIVVISTMEIATLPLYWRRLSRFGILSFFKEAQIAGCALVGFAIGVAATLLMRLIFVA
ncbi:MAG: oligosaccharide flippase family protein [Pseudomonadota bacterium]